MDNGIQRRSDRISLELPIQVVGTDSRGNEFLEQTRTLILSRYGAKILLRRKLVPEQEVMICCPSTKKEAAARVVGQIGTEQNAYAYGVEFLDQQVNLWDIEFPPLSESEKVVARVLLECARCHSREIVHLNDVEAEILASTSRLSRHCKRCGEPGIWQPSRAKESDLESASQTSAPKTKSLDGTAFKMRGCVRHPHFGDEVVSVGGISRTGFVFRSPRHYDPEMPFQAAVPYLPGSENIFVPVQIDRAQFLPEGKVTLYEVSYIPLQYGSRRG
jgi:hypothetical protein